MSPGQLKDAFALDSIFDKRSIDTAGMRRTMVCHGLGASMIIDLMDSTGATEGALHRALERIVGEPVELVASGDWPEWRARGARPSLSTWPTTDRHPTRVAAIVAALRHVAALLEVGE